MIYFRRFHPNVDTGYLPQMFSEDDPRSAAEQLNENYAHGGGWNPTEGWAINRETLAIYYPGDPPLRALAISRLHDQILILYEHDWLVILDKDGKCEVGRVS